MVVPETQAKYNHPRHHPDPVSVCSHLIYMDADATARRKRKRGSISLLGHEVFPDTSPVPRLDLPGSSSAISFAHPKTPNPIPSDETYEWSPSPTPVSRPTKATVRLEDLFKSPRKSEGKIWRGRAGSDETCLDNGPDFGEADRGYGSGIASPHPTSVRPLCQPGGLNLDRDHGRSTTTTNRHRLMLKMKCSMR